MNNRITRLFGIQHPIIQGGMVWVSGHTLASAVSSAGGLGLIGAGSMKPELLREHVRKAIQSTTTPIGVNVPLLRYDAIDLLQAALDEGIRIFFTSAGHPGRHIDLLKNRSATVVHVVANVKQARKAAEVGCDAVVAEGFEAGGHNGIDELTTMVLVPQVVDAVSLPVMAAGGIIDGRQMAAALALGAEGVQVGTRFAATIESSASEAYKNAILQATDTSTALILKKITPVRLLKTPFALKAIEAESSGATRDELIKLLSEKREMKGIMLGDLEEGEFEAGQGSGMIREVQSAADVVKEMMAQCDDTLTRLRS